MGLLGVAVAMPQKALAAPGQAEHGAKGPIVITSKTLSANRDSAFFEGSVVAKADEITLQAERMRVFYHAPGSSEEVSGTGANSPRGVKRIDAEGSVRLLRGDRVVTAQRAVFHTGEEKIIFTGNPRAVQGQNVLTGTKIIYFIKEDRSVVENSRVVLGRGK